VDESDEGGLYGTLFLSTANDNYEEGFDFNENRAGDFVVKMFLVEASRNLEEGLDFEEDDDFQGGGDLIATLEGITANGNGPGGDAGLKIRERGDGDLEATVTGVTTTGNLTGGINIRGTRRRRTTAAPGSARISSRPVPAPWAWWPQSSTGTAVAPS